MNGLISYIGFMSVHGRSRLLKFVDQQAIVGVCFEDVKRLSEQGVRFPFDVLMEWIVASGQIEGLNNTMNKKCVEVVSEYRAARGKMCEI